MARFRNVFTGSVVNVADEKAPRFTSGWEPIDETPKGKASARKPSASRTKKSES